MLLGMLPDGIPNGFTVSDLHIRFHEILPHIPLYQAPKIPDFKEGASFSGKDGFGNADANASSNTIDYGWGKRRVTKVDASTTVFRIGTAVDKNVKIELLKTFAEARAETFEIGDHNLPKFAGFEVTVSFVAVEGEAWNASAGLGLDTKVGIKDTSFDLTVFGTGFRVGTVIGISFFGSEVNINLEKINFKKKGEELINLAREDPVAALGLSINMSNPFSMIIWMVT